MRFETAWISFLYGFLQLSKAQDMNCTVTQNDKQTTYNISGGLNVLDDDTLQYSWTNNSNHVLAHNMAQTPGLVLSHSINTLVTSKCIDKLVLVILERTYYRVTCEINCTQNAPTRSENDKEFSHFWIAVTVAVILLLLLVLVVVFLGFLYYKCRDGTSRRCIGQLGCIYSAVKTPNQLEAGDP